AAGTGAAGALPEARPRRLGGAAEGEGEAAEEARAAEEGRVMSRKKRLTASFVAQDDDGRQHTVEVYTRETGGVVYTSLNTSDGRPLARLCKGVYQVIYGGAILRSESADAP